MDEQIKKLYQEVILKHNNQPYHYEKKATASQIIEAYNPLCGDQFTLFIDWDGVRIKNCWFYGFGCAISKASTSVLVKKLEGQSKEQIKKLLRKFYCVVSPEAACRDLVIEDKDLLAFGGTVAFPERLNCATLSWDQFKLSVE